MAKFKFQLEGVLRQRKQLERQRQRELAIVQAELNQLTAELKALEERTQAANNDLRNNRLTGKLDMSFIAAHRRFMIGVQRQGMSLVQKMALVQKKIDEARLQLFEAAKGRKIIEKLREKQFERWKQEIARRETAELDEVSMQLSYWNSVDDTSEVES